MIINRCIKCPNCGVEQNIDMEISGSEEFGGVTVTPLFDEHCDCYNCRRKFNFIIDTLTIKV